MTLDFLQWQSLKPAGQLEVILVHSSKTVSVHVYFWGILLLWPAFDRTACSRCPCWLVEPSQHLSSQKVCQHYELMSKPYCAFSAYQVWLICSSNLFRLLPFTVKETDSVTSFSPDYISTCL